MSGEGQEGFEIVAKHAIFRKDGGYSENAVKFMSTSQTFFCRNFRWQISLTVGRSCLISDLQLPDLIKKEAGKTLLDFHLIKCIFILISQIKSCEIPKHNTRKTLQVLPVYSQPGTVLILLCAIKIYCCSKTIKSISMSHTVYSTYTNLLL